MAFLLGISLNILWKWAENWSCHFLYFPWAPHVHSSAFRDLSLVYLIYVATRCEMRRRKVFPLPGGNYFIQMWMSPARKENKNGDDNKFALEITYNAREWQWSHKIVNASNVLNDIVQSECCKSTTTTVGHFTFIISRQTSHSLIVS